MARVKIKRHGLRVAKQPKPLIWPGALLFAILILVWVEAFAIETGGKDTELFAQQIALIAPWAILWQASQRIIDGNLFKQYALVTFLFGIGCVSVWWPQDTMKDFVFAFLPLFYIGWLRVLLALFFRNYPALEFFPVLLVGKHSKGGTSYKPSTSEQVFSVLVLVGMFAVIFILATVLK